MSLRRLQSFGRMFVAADAVLALLIMILGGVAAAQEVQTPKWDVFAGYSWLDPRANAAGRKVPTMARGIGTSLTYNLNKWLGVQGDFSANSSGAASTPFQIGHPDIENLAIGPKLTYRGEHFAPFAEGLFGWDRMGLDLTDNHDSRAGFLAGGGVDMPLTKHFGLRLVRADWLVSNHHFSPASLAGAPAFPGSKINVRGARLETGMLFSWGGGPPPAPLALACSVQPNEVMAGEPVKVTATASNVPKNKTVAYTWSATGGKVSGTNETATVDTTGLAPGSYTVTAKGTTGKNSNAECSSNFTVKEPPKNPPTVSCSANPTTVKSGEPSTITCECTSPDNRQVSLSNWTASAGKVTGSGNTATLDTAGAEAGPINVTATCSDDRGLTAQGTAPVTVENPPPPPQASQLCEFDFTNKAKPARVDNAAKACLDQAADSLTQSPNSKGVVVGEQESNERPKTLAAQRAVNAKAYLTSGENQKAIDPSRIEPRTSTEAGKKVAVWIVPEGATFNNPDTTAVDEAKIKPQARTAAAHAKKASGKKASKKAAPAQ